MARSKESQDISITSDKLHNHNCFAYLKIVYNNLRNTPCFFKLDENLQKRLEQALRDEYLPTYQYAHLYKDFFDHIEENLDKIVTHPLAELLQQLENPPLSKSESSPQSSHSVITSKLDNGQGIKKKINDIYHFIHCIYHNDNHILSQTYKHIGPTIRTRRLIDPSHEKAISAQLKDTGTSINGSLTPAVMGSMRGRAVNALSSDFKPQHTTSLATIRHYRHKDFNDPVEYRFGTQGQRHQNIARVSPLFIEWLKIQRQQSTEPQKISHIYFNLLGLDRDDMEGVKEVDLTVELHALEKNNPNIAVITLPADQGFMSANEYKHTDPEFSQESVLDEFLDIACQSARASSPIRDFYISNKIRALVFKKNDTYSKVIERVILKELLEQSFKELNITTSPISRAQSQAVWFHFNKYILPNYLIDKLKPSGINFTCKDAIDRGGVASAYYNLIKSFQSAAPINRDEFEQALHAAAAMVKGRGLNHQMNLIWNAIDAYVNAHYIDIHSNPEKSWLVQWRDLNCPHARVSSLLTHRIKETLTELEDLKNTAERKAPQVELLDKGIAILKNIETQALAGLSGQRLLLETVITTPLLIKTPTNEGIIHYRELANNLTINYPSLYILGGLLKSFIGSVLYVMTCGWANHTMTSGWATFQTGISTLRRDSQTQTMLDLSDKMGSALLKREAVEQFNTANNVPGTDHLTEINLIIEP